MNDLQMNPIRETRQGMLPLTPQIQRHDWPGDQT